MKKLIYIFILIAAIIACSQSLAQNPEFIWAKRAGGNGEPTADTAHGIKIDSNNHIATVRTFNGTADFDGMIVTAVGHDKKGPTDIYETRYDNGGNLI